jgi:hypothetical protein
MTVKIFPDLVAMEIGLRTDAADPAGSLHAKTKDIKDYLAARPWFDWTRLTISFPGGAVYEKATETTLISVSGSGFVTEFTLSADAIAATSGTYYWIVYRDGVVVYTWSAPFSPAPSLTVANIFLRFNSEFKITGYGSVGSYNAYQRASAKIALQY